MNFEQELEQVVQQYRREGYTVTLRPTCDQVPPFAADFGMDILATRPDGNVLVRVVRNRAQLEANPDVPRQADVTNQQPGWSYDLVVVGEDDPLRRLIRGAREPSDEELNNVLEAVDRMVQDGYLPAALVLAWATLEASMRRVASDDVELYLLIKRPAELLRTLYGNGILSREEFDLLHRVFRLRTEIVHGLVPPTIDPTLIPATVRATRRLLTGQPDVQSVAS